VATPILDTLHASVNDRSRHALNCGESPVNDLGIQLLGLSLFLQQSWHWSTISTGLALAPGPAAVLGGSLIVPRLQQRFPIGAVVAFGFVLTAVGRVLMILTLRHGARNYAAAILPGWVVIGFGLGFTVPTTIPGPRQGLGSAALSGVRSGVTVCANPSWL
jgi:hypothetical protein